MTVLQTLGFWIACALSGRGCSELLSLIVPGNPISALIFLLMLIVIVPCCLMPVFIDPRYNKDSYR